MNAAREHEKMFSPEFVNRIDTVITYQPLDKQSYDRILPETGLEGERRKWGRLSCISKPRE